LSLENQRNLACSFCGKGQRDVRKLIAGPEVYICDECVGLCIDIIDEEIAGEERSPRVSVLSSLDPHANLLLPKARRLVESCNRVAELPRPVAERARALAEEIELFASANAESRIVFAEYANSVAVTARHFAKACDALELPRHMAERARALAEEIGKLVAGGDR
jgi:hypothetical protein